MDTKWKNNNKFSLAVAGIAITAVTLLFMVLYPVFEKRAETYYKDEFHSEEFLQGLLQNNYVLNAMVQEKVSGSELNDLYLLRETEEMTIKEAQNEIGQEYSFTDNSDEFYQEYYREIQSEVENDLRQWTNDFESSYAERLDYCVVDQKSGEMIKNTGRNIEDLISADTRSNVSDQYSFYVVLSYDENGKVEDVSVKSSYPDDLLKSVQRIGEWNLVAKNNNKFSEYGNKLVYYAAYLDSGAGVVKTTVSALTPKDVTIVYAITMQQEEAIIGNGNGSVSYDTFKGEGERAYFQAGVAGVYKVFLVILAVLAFLFTRMTKYNLHDFKICQIKVELPVIIAFLVYTVWDSSVVGIVNVTNRGYLRQSISMYFPCVPGSLLNVLVVLINFGYLFLLFACWFYAATCFVDIMKLGVKGFVRERSQCITLYRRVKAWCIAQKNEIAYGDLGKAAEGRIKKLIVLNFFILSGIVLMWFFGIIVLVIYLFIVYNIMKHYIWKVQHQYRKLLDMTGSIAEGNLNLNMDENLGMFESYKEQLDKIQKGFRKAVDEEVKSQKMKTELITNVSHDLKTPLTAITTYIELLKEENITQEQQKEYLNVLERKSMRLKLLIEDLFEVSKANSGNVSMSPVEMDICNLLRQVYLEHEDKIEEAELIVRYRMPEEKVLLYLDSQKTYRIFENLLTNIIKYAMPRTRVYIEGVRTEKGIRIEMKNISAMELNVAAQDLTERFVRGDSSRNTEGSGLGLAIAKSFTELQGGKLTTEIDGDLYKVILEW